MKGSVLLKNATGRVMWESKTWISDREFVTLTIRQLAFIHTHKHNTSVSHAHIYAYVYYAGLKSVSMKTGRCQWLLISFHRRRNLYKENVAHLDKYIWSKTFIHKKHCCKKTNNASIYQVHHVHRLPAFNFFIPLKRKRHNICPWRVGDFRLKYKSFYTLRNKHSKL